MCVATVFELMTSCRRDLTLRAPLREEREDLALAWAEARSRPSSVAVAVRGPFGAELRDVATA